MAALTSEEIIEREKTKAWLDAVNSKAKKALPNRGYISSNLVQAFEHIGCSCGIERSEVAVLEKQRDEEVSIQLRNAVEIKLRDRESEEYQNLLNGSGSWVSTLKSDLSKSHENTSKLASLRAEIAKKDREEHGPLNRQAREAAPWMKTWLMEQPMDTILLDEVPLFEAYATAWVHNGWRPEGKTNVY